MTGFNPHGHVFGMVSIEELESEACVKAFLEQYLDDSEPARESDPRYLQGGSLFWGRNDGLSLDVNLTRIRIPTSTAGIKPIKNV